MDPTNLIITSYNRTAQRYTDLYFHDQTDLPFVKKEFIARLPKNASVLDAGCGPGTFTQLFMGTNMRVTGIDLSDNMLTIARKNVPNATFLKMDISTLTFPNASFDGIIAAYSLIHILTRQVPKVLHGFHRILTPNGILCIIGQKGEADHWMDDPDVPSEKMFFNFFTKERLSSFLTKAGFSILALEEQRNTSSFAEAYIYAVAKK
ncbi:methyltransferase domain-containing protein [Candidatus Gottesmanbacteria bacterium]|nr:methyltransferase domain-containing protein [Candidatus Gottesmanbacteria bacterium]